MKRFLLLLVATSLWAATSLQADDTTRAAQERLKKDGFYFGEVNGTAGSETSAAITRYQIRHGLAISGQLDAETVKSLRLKPGTAAPAPVDSESDTWRRLRKSDQQFLSGLNARKSPATPARSARTAPPPPPASAAPASAEVVFTLSQERLRDYVGAFVLAGLDRRVGAELEFFANRVKYYNRGAIPREQIRQDLVRYNQRWPQRRFWLAGEVQVEPRPDSLLRVTFPLRYELRSGSERSSGKVLKTLLVEVTGEDLQIVSVNERKAR
ncbi:hypothetical protein BH20VER1_BH20VER1_13970 [soil metagenome]